jgi:hypothetical protein
MQLGHFVLAVEDLCADSTILCRNLKSSNPRTEISAPAAGRMTSNQHHNDFAGRTAGCRKQNEVAYFFYSASPRNC